MDFRIGYRRRLRTAYLLRKKQLRLRVLLGTASAVAIAAIGYYLQPAPPLASSTALAAPTLRIVLNSQAPVATAARRIYPYSIVPGGVASKDDLIRRVTSDKVVARHYASFNIDKTHAVRVSQPRAVHVSYRRGDKVYWTANKVMLARGETLLSDGSSEIRGRCGNRISDTAMLPVAMGEPTAAELDSSMSVAPDGAEDGSLQNASFALDEPVLAANPTQFQQFPGVGITPDAAPVTPRAPSGMPSVPPGAQNGMGLMPSRYLTVASAPATALGPTTIGAVTVTPSAAGAPAVPASVTPPVDTPAPGTPSAPMPPATPDAPATPATPVTPETPAVPPVKTPLPHGDIPEPGTLWLVGAAFVLLLSMTRNKGLAGKRRGN